MTRMVWRITSMLLLVTYVFSAGGQGGQLVLCVPTDGHPEVEFVDIESDRGGKSCQHEDGASILASICTPTCHDHHAGCVDIPLSIATTAVPIKSLRAQAPQASPIRCPLPLAEVITPSTTRAPLPATPPPAGGGFLPSLRTVVLLT